MSLTYAQMGMILLLLLIIALVAWSIPHINQGEENPEEDAIGYVDQDRSHVTINGRHYATDEINMRYWDGSDWIAFADLSAPAKSEGTPGPDDWKHSSVKAPHAD